MPAMTGVPRQSSRRTRWTTVAFFVCLLWVYSANLREIGAGDTVPALLLPVAILRGDGLNLSRFAALWPGRLPWYVTLKRGDIVSNYPVGVALLAVPLIAPQLVVLDAVQPRWEQQQAFLIWPMLMGKNAAALLAALTGVALLALLRRLTSEHFAILAAAIAALGSTLWAVASQSMWQHGPAALALTLAVALLLAPGASRSRLCLAGLAAAVLVGVRPQDIVFSLAIFAWAACATAGGSVGSCPFRC